MLLPRFRSFPIMTYAPLPINSRPLNLRLVSSRLMVLRAASDDNDHNNDHNYDHDRFGSRNNVTAPRNGIRWTAILLAGIRAPHAIPNYGCPPVPSCVPCSPYASTTPRTHLVDPTKRAETGWGLQAGWPEAHPLPEHRPVQSSKKNAQYN